MITKLENITLSAAWLTLLIVGALLLADPTTMYDASHVDLGGDPNLLSEIRASGALLFALAYFVGRGLKEADQKQNSLLLTAVIFLSYAAARLFSMLEDGMPEAPLLIATVVELVIGAAALILYEIRSRGGVKSIVAS